MLASYKEKKYLILSLVVLLLDGLISYYYPSFFHQQNYFFPMLSISLLPFLYKNNTKDYYRLSLILGFIYDLLFSHIFLLNTLIFFMLAKVNVNLLKVLKNNLFTYLLLVIINICLYDIILFSLILLTGYANVSIVDLYNKITHSLLLNILSVFVFFFLFKKRKRRA